jgi:hypothetical protein
MVFVLICDKERGSLGILLWFGAAPSYM